MRVLTLDRVGHWTRWADVLALAALAWAVFVPGGVFWTGVLAGGLIGSAVATAVLTAHRAPHAVRGLVLVNAALPPAIARLPSANTIRFLGPPLIPGIASRLVARARDSRSVEDHVSATLDFVTADARRLPQEVREAAHAMEKDRLEALSKGFDGYVTKPLKIADLLAEIKRCLAAPSAAHPR